MAVAIFFFLLSIGIYPLLHGFNRQPISYGKIGAGKEYAICVYALRWIFLSRGLHVNR